METLEDQFGLKRTGVPEIYYKPRVLPDLADTVLIDENWIFGATHRLQYDRSLLQLEAELHAGDSGRILYSQPKAQDIFTYVDMIHSCKYFITLISGGNALAAALRKPSTVILPENLDGGSLSNFLFNHAPIIYKRNRSLLGYNLKHRSQHARKKRE